MSYHHSSDYSYLKQLREKIVGRNLSDYGFKEEDLGENSKYHISRKIQYRIWSSSVVIVLVGERTGESGWIDWEIWYSLQSFRNPKVKRRAFKPKGIVALYLPVKEHNIPERLYAVRSLRLRTHYVLPGLNPGYKITGSVAVMINRIKKVQ